MATSGPGSELGAGENEVVAHFKGQHAGDSGSRGAMCSEPTVAAEAEVVGAVAPLGGSPPAGGFQDLQVRGPFSDSSSARERASGSGSPWAPSPNDFSLPHRGSLSRP